MRSNNKLDEYFSTLSEKIILIRHDVDNIFLMYNGSLKSKIKKALNYLYLALPLNLNVRHIIPHYLENVQLSIELERMYNARATYFFRVVTAPTNEILEELKKHRHEIAYHADRDYSYSTFYSDLKLLEKIVKSKIYGYSKHGFSPIRSGAPWDEGKIIEFGVKAKLKYLAQGEGHPEWKYPKRVSGLWVFGHHRTLKKVKPREIKEYVSQESLPLILVHPEDLSIPGEKEKFEEVLTLGRVKPIIEVVLEIEKLLLENH